MLKSRNKISKYMADNIESHSEQNLDSLDRLDVNEEEAAANLKKQAEEAASQMALQQQETRMAHEADIRKAFKEGKQEGRAENREPEKTYTQVQRIESKKKLKTLKGEVESDALPSRSKKVASLYKKIA